MQRIMVVEDDPATREELALLLENEGYEAFSASDFADIPGQAARRRPDLILLDIGLPGQDGIALCAALRRAAGEIPVIFVTGRSSGWDEVRALSMGGDDYITKPYDIPVLLARIRAVLRRAAHGPEALEELEANGLRLHLTRGMASAGEKTVLLTRNEMQILACLMARPGEIISRADLIEALWDSQVYIDDNTLSVNMTRLRGKLADLGLPEYIRTRRGMGYQL